MASFWNNIANWIGPAQDSNDPTSSQEYWDGIFGQMGGDQTLYPNRYAMPTQEVHTEDRGVVPTPGAAPAPEPLPPVTLPPALPELGTAGIAPRLAMPTQETHTEQRFIDQSVGAEPTATEHGGRMFELAASMREDPLALAAFNPDRIDWERSTSDPRFGGEYVPPAQPFGDPLNIGDTVRFWRGMPPDQRTGLPFIDLPLTSQPGFVPLGRHEFRHRGTELLQGMAQEAGMPFDRTQPPFNVPYEESERLNVFEDRRLGETQMYHRWRFAPDAPIDPSVPEITPELAALLRQAADRVLSYRVQRLHSNPNLTWRDVRR